MGDTGLTGRKIIVDTYGGAAPHGGGAFSGKDPTKVDRSAAYAARYVAKNVVAAGLADRCQIQVAYAIGVAQPFSILVETFGTEHVPVATIEELVSEHFDLRPAAILRDLDLRRPIYAKTAAYGHFGRDDARLHVGADGQGRPRSAPPPASPTARQRPSTSPPRAASQSSPLGQGWARPVWWQPPMKCVHIRAMSVGRSGRVFAPSLLAGGDGELWRAHNRGDTSRRRVTKSGVSAGRRGRRRLFSPIAFSTPPTTTRNWPAAGSAARSSTTSPGTSPSS